MLIYHWKDTRKKREEIDRVYNMERMQIDNNKPFGPGPINQY